MDDTLRFLSIIDKKCNKVRKTKEIGKKFPVPKFCKQRFMFLLF